MAQSSGSMDQFPDISGVKDITLYSFDCLPFPKGRILDCSKLKEFADDNFKFNENGIKFSKLVEKTVEKEGIARYEPFLSSTVFLKDLYCRPVKLGLVWERVKCSMVSKILSQKTGIIQSKIFLE